MILLREIVGGELADTGRVHQVAATGQGVKLRHARRVTTLAMRLAGGAHANLEPRIERVGQAALADARGAAHGAHAICRSQGLRARKGET